jgi:prepilin-type N-terminal cleavage/methylation domain-containing protein
MAVLVVIMISPTGQWVSNMKRRSKAQGMTLVELILVMLVLATVLAISAPTLSRFFKGRALVEESRRMLALTRYGRSQAIALCVPMQLWIDAETGQYGLEPDPGYEIEDEKPIEYVLANSLYFEIDQNSFDEEGLAYIFFHEDGAIDYNSLQSLQIREENNGSMEIALAESGFGYLIEDGQ